MSSMIHLEGKFWRELKTISVPEVMARGKPGLAFCGFADIFLFKTLLSNEAFSQYYEDMEAFPQMRVSLNWWKERKSRYHMILNQR